MNEPTPAPIVADTDAGRTGYIAPDVPDDAPQTVREGIARRRILLAEGKCPCGAEFVTPSRQQLRHARRHGEVLHVTIWHTEDCPAGDTILLPAIRAWRGR